MFYYHLTFFPYDEMYYFVYKYTLVNKDISIYRSGSYQPFPSYAHCLEKRTACLGL